jgi:hypothetical protein
MHSLRREWLTYREAMGLVGLRCTNLWEMICAENSEQVQQGRRYASTVDPSRIG